VTLFAARGLVDSGTEPLTATFRFVASTFSDVVTFDWERLASGVAGDFAYTAAVERYTNSRGGGPPEHTELRATHVYRGESGTGALCTAMPIADLPARDLTGDSISPTGLRASAGPGIGSARIRHRTCA
jgi:hypothetical protein